MSTFRVTKDKNNPYVMINKSSLQDERLSWKAKGLLVYLLSLPDDWKIYETELINHAKDGRDGTRSAIKELIDAGYITRERTRDEKGRLTGTDYNVYEVPTYDGKSNIGFSNVGKTNTTNNDLTNNKLTKISNNYSLSDDKRVSYILFWQVFNKADLQGYDDAAEWIRYFFSKYYMVYGENHPTLRDEQMQHALDIIRGHDVFYGDNARELIDAYFNTEFKQGCDYNLNHFVTGNIIETLYYKHRYYR